MIKKEYNRAIVIMVIGIFSALWVATNSQTWWNGAILYMIYGAVGIGLYLAWDKIRLFGK